MKSVDVKSNTYIGSNVKNNDKYPKFEHCKNTVISPNLLVCDSPKTMWKLFLSTKCTLQSDLKKILRLKNLKILFRGHNRSNNRRRF